MAMTHDYLDQLDQNVGIAPANSQEEYQAAQTIADLQKAVDEAKAKEDAAKASYDEAAGPYNEAASARDQAKACCWWALVSCR